MLNEKEVAEILGMSVWWVRRKRQTGGGVPYIKMSPGERGGVRYEIETVEAFKRSRVQRSTCDQGGDDQERHAGGWRRVSR